ncbi:hypothetical protein [Streptomyces sp. NPDC097619]|uniref:hypothetical protein n=1 Tax=Streptomyces sp. NPDC097619 TaxID=3157228 RepID=UPI003327B992
MTDPAARIRSGTGPADCVPVLAAAFAREPATRWICGDAPRTRARWFAATLAAQAGLPGARSHLLTGADGTPIAAAVLTPPGAGPGLRARAAWAARTLVGCGPRPLTRTLRYLEATEHLPPEDAWTLEFLGVRPDRAGRGEGGALLRHVLADTPAGVRLTTADPANVPFYARYGFTVRARPAVGHLAVTAMHRPATG